MPLGIKGVGGVVLSLEKGKNNVMLSTEAFASHFVAGSTVFNCREFGRSGGPFDCAP